MPFVYDYLSVMKMEAKKREKRELIRKHLDIAAYNLLKATEIVDEESDKSDLWDAMKIVARIALKYGDR